MTKTQYYTATSIDGFIADQDNSLDWLFEVPEGRGNPFARFLRRRRSLRHGRDDLRVGPVAAAPRCCPGGSGRLSLAELERRDQFAYLTYQVGALQI